jgi:hypothetical protein
MEKTNYLGNINVKKDGIQEGWDKESILEYQRCMQSAEYFTLNYCKIINLDDGLVPFEMYDYQKEMFKHFDDNRFSIVLACRQSGKSISTVAYLLWFALFNPDKTIAVLANKGSTAREMLSRVTLMLENLPFFLQPGTKALNKGSLEFSNNSRIIASATSGSSIRGMSINLLYLDEFAFVENATEFYTSTYPVITSGTTTKVIITSTANGVGNQFYRIWEGAESKSNSYIPFRVDWHDVPGRDDEWRKETIANTSRLQFDQEYGNTFHGTGKTLFDPNILLAQQAKNPIERVNGVNIYKKPIAEHDYVMTVDVSRGRGLDYSTFTIIDVTDLAIMQQVATFRDNRISPLIMPDLLVKFGNLYNEAWIVIESNDAGQVVCNGVFHELEYENMFVESMVRAGALGINMTKKVKRIGCSNIKDIIDEGKLSIVDADTVQEMCTFALKGTSYEALQGNHDDLVMNLVMFGYFSNTDFFKDMFDSELKSILFKEKLQVLEDDVPSFGIFDDGSDDEVTHERVGGELWEIHHS